MSNKAVFGCLAAFLVLALLVSVAFNVLMLAGKALSFMDAPPMQMLRQREKMYEKVELEGKAGVKDRIVHIDVEGVITSADVGGGLLQADFPLVETVKRSLAQAVEDVNVKAIVIRVNSPGGEVTASDILHMAVKKAAEKKPVVVYMDSMATSGGYYLACGASQIVASETTLTASIGVIMENISYHEAFGKLGLGVQTFVSGDFKDTLGGHRPMREDEKAYVQSLVTKMYDRFVGIVAEARKLPVEALKSGVADGRVVTGREALEQKLVDQIGYIEDAYALAKKMGKAPDAMVVKYGRSMSFFDFLSSAKSTMRPKDIKIDMTSSLLPRLEPGRAYYLPLSHAR